jgi:cytochrome c556
MRHTPRPVLLAAALAALLGSAVSCAAEKPENIVAYRQGIMVAMAWNIGPQGKMIKGDIALDDARFAFLAARAASLAPMALEGFTPDTAQVKSHVKPELWQHQDDFKKRMGELETATAELAKVAARGDHQQMRLLFGDTVKICKGCHDEYQHKH